MKPSFLVLMKDDFQRIVVEVGTETAPIKNEILASISIFDDLTRIELKGIASECNIRHLAVGEYFLNQNFEKIFFIGSGKVSRNCVPFFTTLPTGWRGDGGGSPRHPPQILRYLGGSGDGGGFQGPSHGSP